MRLILPLLLIASAQAFLSLEIKAQSQAPSCPTISISCPSDGLKPDEPAMLSVNITGGNSHVNPKYKWKVSVGKIASGQGTPTIVIDTAGSDGQSITVTIEIEGFQPECDMVRSCTLSALIIDPPWATKFDEYDFLNWKKERERLDNLAIQLQQSVGAKGYVIVYGPQRVDQHLARVRDYLVKKRGIDSERIVLVNGGHNKKVRTELWVVPTGADPPPPNPNF